MQIRNAHRTRSGFLASAALILGLQAPHAWGQFIFPPGPSFTLKLTSLTFTNNQFATPQPS
jgi:hypothetical protein